MSDSIVIYDPDCPYCNGGGYTSYKHTYPEGVGFYKLVPVKADEVAKLSDIEQYERFEEPLHCDECERYVLDEDTVQSMIAELRRLGVSDDIWKDNEKWRESKVQA